MKTPDTALLEARFPVGSLVRLAAGPDSAPGRVLAVKRRRVIVHWSDLSYTGRHKADALVTAEPKRNPYARLLAKLDASRAVTNSHEGGRFRND